MNLEIRSHPAAQVLATVDRRTDDVHVLDHEIADPIDRGGLDSPCLLQFLAKPEQSMQRGASNGFVECDRVIGQGLILSSVCGNPMIAEAGGGSTASGGGLAR